MGKKKNRSGKDCHRRKQCGQILASLTRRHLNKVEVEKPADLLGKEVRILEYPEQPAQKDWNKDIHLPLKRQTRPVKKLSQGDKGKRSAYQAPNSFGGTTGAKVKQEIV